MNLNSFGEYLRKLRIDREITLRDFAKKTGMDVGNLSKVERGTLNPPKKQVLRTISKSLKLTEAEEQKLYDLASHDNGKYPEDVNQKLQSYEFIPLLLRTIANKKLTDEQIRELAERINSKK